MYDVEVCVYIYIYMLSCCEPLITEHEWSKMPIEYEKQAINN